MRVVDETWEEQDGVISLSPNSFREAWILALNNSKEPTEEARSEEALRVTSEDHESCFDWEQGINFGAFGMLQNASPFNASPRSTARARLASAAPEMARLLLAIEWSAEVFVDRDESVAGCPSCEGLKKHTHRPWIKNHVGHTESCALDAVLRKAGVR